MNTITKITDSDIPTLVQMARTTFADTFTTNTAPSDMAEFLDTAYAPAQLLKELHTPGTTFWFVCVDGQPAGYLKLNVDGAVTEDVPNKAALELERIYILPDFKHQGLGSLLYEQAVKVAKAHHKSCIDLGVWEHNVAAQHFYQKRGFHKIGEHAFVVGDDPQRDWLMEADI